MTTITVYAALRRSWLLRLGLVCIGSLDAETQLARGPRRELLDRKRESYEWKTTPP
jgi:hypothetical protein